MMLRRCPSSLRGALRSHLRMTAKSAWPMPKSKPTKRPVDLLTAKQAKAEHARLHGRDRRARQALLPGGRADGHRRRVRRAARALRRDRGALSRSAHARIAVAQGRRGADARGFAKVRHARADALARQRLRRGGRASTSSAASAASSSFRDDEPIAFTRRAEDRRPVDVAALRGRRARHRRDARRRQRGRGRHRQYPDAQGRAAAAQGQRRAGGLRGARRGLHDQGRLPRAQRAAEGGRRAASSPTRATPPPARCARTTRRSPLRGRSASSPMPGAR